MAISDPRLHTAEGLALVGAIDAALADPAKYTHQWEIDVLNQALMLAGTPPVGLPEYLAAIDAIREWVDANEPAATSRAQMEQFIAAWAAP